MAIKDFIKKKYASFEKTQKENREFDNKLKAKIKEARQKEFIKQAIISSKISARNKAKAKYNPNKQSLSGGGMTPEARALIYGSGSFGQPVKKKKKQSNGDAVLNKLLYG